MAYVGIQGTPCPKCGSSATQEVHKPTGGGGHERQISLYCHSCSHDAYWGVYKLLGNTLIEVR